MSKQEQHDSAGVQDFYERYPYPRPIDDLQKYRELWQDKARRRADYHLASPARAYRENHSILIAGCGTSQAAKHAMRWPEAHVTAVDFSATSVRHTEELKRKYSLDNLKVRQLAIEDAVDLEMNFDQIVCTGVLHHLPDPDAGLRALRSVLHPDGALHLMVYAPYGRAGIYMLQEFCKRVGIHATDENIRDLVEALKVLPAGHPMKRLLTDAPDFRSDEALADALLHPQDRAYSVPQLFHFLESAGLKFGRWVKQAPYSPHCGILAKIPQASAIAQLRVEEQYAAAELFRGTMVSHSVIAYRNDNTSSLQATPFAGDFWLRCVPIRMPDTICIHDRLPPGAAAVLINRTHTFTDLFMPIDSIEKGLFEAIDGTRCFADIVGRISADKSQLETMRLFYEKLWWWDQLVFDASKGNRSSDAIVGESV